MAKNIFIARHGLTQWNLEGKVQGQADIPLLEGGIKQAYALAEKIRDEQIPISKILTSPLQRAKKTAQIVSDVNNIEVFDEPALTEWCFGKFEGIPHPKEFHEAKKQFANSYESGESLLKLSQRVYNLLDRIKNEEINNILLVTHGGVAKVIHSYFFDMTNEEFSSFFLENCEIREYNF